MFELSLYSKFSLSLNVPKHAWIVSLSLAFYHPKHNSNSLNFNSISTQIGLNFNSKQLQPKNAIKVFSVWTCLQNTLDFLKSIWLYFCISLKPPSISQNLLDCFFCKKIIKRKIPQNQLKMVLLIIGWSIAQNDLKIYSPRSQRLWASFCYPPKWHPMKIEVYPGANKP